ncbi:rhamnogalacturonan lyase [Sorangium sp. So ce1182]
MRALLSAALLCACGAGDSSAGAGGAAGHGGGEPSGSAGSGSGSGSGSASGGSSSAGSSSAGGSPGAGGGGTGGGSSLDACVGAGQEPAGRLMENLGRGLVAVRTGDGVYVGWRLLGTDPPDVAFNLYRDGTRINAEPIAASTNHVDRDGGERSSYEVRPVLQGQEQAPSKPATVIARNYITVPLQTLPGHTPNDASVGDLDGDGELEIVLKQEQTPRDNSQKGSTGETKLEAYELDGTLLWRINLGRNIREGAHYTQFMVFDFDGDGRAEVAAKTADGTVDGKGKILGDRDANHRNGDGYVLRGPEFLTVFDGRTGGELATVDYIPARGNVGDWGDNYGNRVDRFLAGVAYLDGKRPSFVMSRGYYTRTVIAAWNWRDGQLTNVWTFDSKDGHRDYAGQGNHQLSVGDVDADGKDEIVYGAMAIDDDGSPLWNTRYGHGDAMHLTDIDPDRPGIEVFDIQERFDDAGAHLNDARTGETLWKKASKAAGEDGEGPGRGVAADLDPAHRGLEMWVAGAGLSGSLWNVRGDRVGDAPSSCNFVVWWDADPLRELLDRNRISKYGGGNLLTADGCDSNNGTKATPALSADLFGDWREEVMWRTTDGKALRIYTTTIPTDRRIHTLLHDPQYRLGIAWQNVAYNQPPHTSFYLGDGMADPPAPEISVPCLP